MGTTTTAIPDADIFAAAKRAYPNAVDYCLMSLITANDRSCEWSLSIGYGRKPSQRKWKVVARAWSRSELLLRLRATSPCMDRLYAGAADSDGELPL
jgi:hypothetical protein